MPQSAIMRLLLPPWRSRSRKLLVGIQLKASSPVPALEMAGQEASSRNDLHRASCSPVSARSRRALPLTGVARLNSMILGSSVFKARRSASILRKSSY